jgi:hypothetical protein
MGAEFFFNHKMLFVGFIVVCRNKCNKIESICKLHESIF